GPLRDLLLLRPSGGRPFAGDVQHPVAPRLCSRARAPARLPWLLRSGMSIIGIQAQVSPERSAPAQWNMGGVQRGYRTCPVSDEAFRLLQQRAEDDEHSPRSLLSSDLELLR